jgi:hypothetical protein
LHVGSLDFDIRFIDAATGKLIRELTLGPDQAPSSHRPPTRPGTGGGAGAILRVPNGAVLMPRTASSQWIRRGEYGGRAAEVLVFGWLARVLPTPCFVI